ncbi:MAG TPA: PepSY domain-containing protein [Allosphingosinicella sp.]|nr:PepSY domain-containing protein [Allosphingosinicella sp.]
MAGTGLWAKIHKWLALLMAIQILFWFASGLFFAAFPIERVRSEHMIAEQPAAPVDLAVAAAGLGRLTAAPAEKVELRSLLGRPVALLTARQARPRLYDLASGRLISPITMAEAVLIAEADHAGHARALRVKLITANDTEYRGALPAWRVDFAEEGRALYVAADTGAVTARRSTLWRVYDFLWGLHIMDWRGHEDFNTPLLIVATALALLMSIAGIVLLPGRLGFTAWLRRRRRRAQERAS